MLCLDNLSNAEPIQFSLYIVSISLFDFYHGCAGRCQSLSDDVLIYILRKKVTYRTIDVTSDAPERHGLLNIIVEKKILRHGSLEAQRYSKQYSHVFLLDPAAAGNYCRGLEVNS